MNIRTIHLGIDNCYLLDGERCVFIDGGAPNQSRAFVKRMAALGIAPSKVALVILTHAHWDHIGSVHALVELTGAKLAVHTRERAIVERGLKSMPPGVTLWGAIFGVILRAFLPFIVIPPTHVDIEIGDDGLSLEPYGVPGRVVYTPGHSPGSVSIVLDSGEAFVGDLAMNGLPLTRRPDMPIFAEDIWDGEGELEEVAEARPHNGLPRPRQTVSGFGHGTQTGSNVTSAGSQDEVAVPRRQSVTVMFCLELKSRLCRIRKLGRANSNRESRAEAK